jgi:hypothetical protein
MSDTVLLINLFIAYLQDYKAFKSWIFVSVVHTFISKGQGRSVSLAYLMGDGSGQKVPQPLPDLVGGSCYLLLW